jgi:hypothetical protein
VIAKSAKRKTDVAVATAADRSSTSPPNRSAPVTDSDIARRAYDLYVARGGDDGHDLDDWLQAERELRAASSTAQDLPEVDREND